MGELARAKSLLAEALATQSAMDAESVATCYGRALGCITVALEALANVDDGSERCDRCGSTDVAVTDDMGGTRCATHARRCLCGARGAANHCARCGEWLCTEHYVESHCPECLEIVRRDEADATCL